MRSMHLALVCGEYPPCKHGGIGSFSRDLAEGLVERGHRVTVVGVYTPSVKNLDGDVEEVQNGVRVVRLHSSRGLPSRSRPLWDRIRLSAWLRQRHSADPFDVIEAPDWGGMLACGSLPKTPLVARLHGSTTVFNAVLKRPPSRLTEWFERRWLKRAHHLLAVSDFVGRQTNDVLGLPCRNYRVIHNSVRSDILVPSSEVELDKDLVVYVNTVSPKKGFGELILAMNRVFDSWPSVRMNVFGNDTIIMPDNRSYGTHMMDLVRPELDGRIVLSGWIPNEQVKRQLAAAAVCCYPSHVESCPIGPLEAMSMAKAVVFMKDGPGPEIVIDGVSGLLCNTRDPEDIAQKVLSLLQDQDMASTYGAAARKRILECFDSKIWMDKNLAFYSDLLCGHHD